VSDVHADSRAVARAAAAAFGAHEPTVRQWLDEGEAHAVHLMACADRPAAGFTTYSTVTLHQAPNVLDGENVPVELAGVASTDAKTFGNLLATAALYVMKDRWLAAPGVVFPELVNQYDPSSRLEHVLWAPPFPWEQLGSVQVADDLTVHWLLAVPISEAERKFLVTHGFDALEQLFAEHELDYFDLSRSSLI